MVWWQLTEPNWFTTAQRIAKYRRASGDYRCEDAEQVYEIYRTLAETPINWPREAPKDWILGWSTPPAKQL